MAALSKPPRQLHTDTRTPLRRDVELPVPGLAHTSRLPSTQLEVRALLQPDFVLRTLGALQADSKNTATRADPAQCSRSLARHPGRAVVAVGVRIREKHPPFSRQRTPLLRWTIPQ